MAKRQKKKDSFPKASKEVKEVIRAWFISVAPLPGNIKSGDDRRRWLIIYKWVECEN